ncbi:hypothetical protein ABEG18_25130 [Alsobacter sp. KACC 23698]|uniref:UrcA family protein n=1 Tax=Alsobacter sp. KACC 23698 TaxID=3149229 RepID=A0AAU7JFS7_9HYPH
MIKVAVLTLGLAVVTQVAENIPRYDIDASCRAQTSSRDGTGERMAACVRDETAAREQLASSWARAKPRSREVCAGEERGITSYADLASCLDMFASQ